MYEVIKIRGPARNYDAAELISMVMPRIGESMNLYRGDNGRRVFTSAVTRVLHSSRGATYFQTRNSVYRVQALAHSPFRLPKHGSGW